MKSVSHSKDVLKCEKENVQAHKFYGNFAFIP